MKAPDILKAAAGHMEDRAATYDKPEGERSMAATVSAFRCVTGHALTEEQGWLFMQLLKAVRSQQGDYRADSYEDGAAYASLAGEAAYRERVTQALGCSDPYADTHLDLRMDTIARNGNDGEHYAEDMSNPANWRAGDLVECVRKCQSFDVGNTYPVVQGNMNINIVDNDGDKRDICISNNFRFHSRPSQVNEAEMSGIWHHHDEWTMPCDPLSMVEIETRDGTRVTGQANRFYWKELPGNAGIVKYRML